MATEIDYRYEEYKKFYPDTVKATLTMGKNLNKEQAQKLVDQYTTMVGTSRFLTTHSHSRPSHSA